jgi:ribosomal-protein-alanine N-acetyltransferase
MVVPHSMSPRYGKAIHTAPYTLNPRLRQFRAEDADAMHECFADPEAMRFWNRPVHTKRIETERAVRSYIDCTPSYYRFWAVADARTDRCIGLVSYHDGHIRSKRVAIAFIIDPSRFATVSRRERGDAGR